MMDPFQQCLQVGCVGDSLHDFKEGLALYFSFLTSSNIRHGPNHPKWRAIFVSLNIGTVTDVGVGTVLKQETIFFHPDRIATRDEGVQFCNNTLTIIRMDVIVPPPFLGTNLL